MHKIDEASDEVSVFFITMSFFIEEEGGGSISKWNLDIVFFLQESHIII